MSHVLITGLLTDTPIAEQVGLAKESPTRIQRMRPALGTLCTIDAGGSSQVLASAIEQAFAALAEVERCMHPTRTGSDLALLAAEHSRAITVNAMTWEVLALAHRIHNLSDACFDPCLPSRAGRLSDVELLPNDVVICHRPVAIDLGGIAKGYAVDRAIAVLRELGCEFGMVNAGGDLRVFGRQQHVIVRLEAAKEATLVLHDAALAVSDALSARHPSEYQGYYQRGSACEPRHRQAVVSASTTAVADALTKCAMFCDPANLQSLLQPFNAAAVVLR